MRQHTSPFRPVPPFEIQRTALNNLLDSAVQQPLVVVQAGAGFGKTQGVARFLEQSPYRSVWLSFSVLDNIPARFWENLTAAVQRYRPALAEKLRQLGFPDSLRAFTSFLSEITAALYRDNQFVVFVFDDVHLVTEPLLLQFLARLIGAKLENNSIVLITRQWPLWEQPLPVVPRMIGPGALRFGPEETRALFEKAGVPVEGETVGEIYRYVSGWPIGLSTMLMALQRGEGFAEPGQLLSRSKPALFVLFEQEIFSQYTPAEQHLVTLLSVLDSFPRGIVHAVTGEKGRDLNQLLATNTFMQYDTDAKRFIFHPLYQEFLREKLLSLKKEDVADAYRRAADWCRENGHYYDALNYYQQCGCTEALWETLLLFHAKRRTHTESALFIRHIEAMPEAFTRQHPMTHILLSVLLANNMQFGKAASVLDKVQQQVEAAGDTAMLGECHIARGLILLAQEQNGFDTSFEQAAALLPKGSRRWGKGLQLVDLGPALHLQSAKAGELKKTLASFVRGVPPMVQVLHGAGQGLDKLCESEFYFLTGEPKKALEPAYQALYTAQQAEQFDIAGNALFLILRVYALVGDYQKLMEAFQQVNAFQKDERSANFGIWDIAKGWFYAELGEVDKVAPWIRLGTHQSQPPISTDRAILVQLRCLIATGRTQEALALLATFEAIARQKSAVITLLYIEISRAVAHYALEEYGPAITALKAAFQLARGNHILMPFVEYGNRTRALLERARTTPGHGIPKDWLAQTHAKASTYAKRHAYMADRYRQSLGNQVSDFGLSKREIQLLADLGQGLTREEIAESMDLSLNTVKSMVKQIFSKLGAVNSADAIRIAVVNRLI